MRKPRPFKPRIKLVAGKWYAYAPNNSHEARCALVPAISFCRRMNAAGKGGAV